MKVKDSCQKGPGKRIRIFFKIYVNRITPNLVTTSIVEMNFRVLRVNM